MKWFCDQPPPRSLHHHALPRRNESCIFLFSFPANYNLCKKEQGQGKNNREGLRPNCFIKLTDSLTQIMRGLMLTMISVVLQTEHFHKISTCFSIMFILRENICHFVNLFYFANSSHIYHRLAYDTQLIQSIL